MMKKTLLAAAMLATSSAALAEISANVTLASDYVFRGISQTDNQIAIQGGFDYAQDNGFYVGTWASNVDPDFFNGDRDKTRRPRSISMSVTVASTTILATTSVTCAMSIPGFGDADTNEVYVSGSYMGFGLSVNYSDELSFLPSN